MRRFTIKNILARKFRLVLTSLAVVLGVSFVSGTFVLTDTLGNVFDDLFADVNRGVDVAVRARAAFDEKAGGPGAQVLRVTVPAALLTEVSAVDGVRAAEGGVTGSAVVVRLGRDGKPKEAIQRQAPTLGVAWGTDRQLSRAFGGDGRAEVGRRPRGPHEVAIDAVTAREAGIRPAAVRRCVRDRECRRARVAIQFNEAPAPYDDPETFRWDVVGIFRFGTVGNLAGATLAAFETETAQEVLNKVDRYDEIRVAAAPGVSQVELRDHVRERLRAQGDAAPYEVLTGEQLAKDQSDEIRDNLSFFNTFLLIFALIALFVGAFIIYNTFSIIVAQRTRELGLLRAIGASGRQVMGSVAVEAVIVGLVSSVLGLGLGIGLALGLQELMRAFNFDLPSGTTVVALRTIIASLVAGTLVTVVSAVAPARRAARISPMAAITEQPPSSRVAERRYVWGAVVTVAGVMLLPVGLFADSDVLPGGAAGVVGVGAALVFVGVAMLSPLVALPVTRALGWLPARWRGMAGVLARENALRHPRRTASTAAALMIGLAIVSLVAIFGSSIKQTVRDVVESDLKAEIVLRDPNFLPFSPETAAAVRATVPGAAVTEFRGSQILGPFELDGDTKVLSGVNTNLGRTFDLHPRGAALARFRADGGMLVFEDAYRELPARMRRQGRMEVRFPGDPRGTTTSVPIAGVFEQKPLGVDDYLLDMREYNQHYETRADVFVAVKLPAGMPVERAQRRVEEALAAFPNVQIENRAEFLESQEAQVGQFINLMYLLLVLAVLIAFIGIANTLALSVFERTREIGLLRAVGMTRSQLRRMIRYEAAIISVFGALLGLALGVLFGLALVAALRDDGIQLGIPVGQLLAFVVAAGVVGLGIGLFPARRAARLDVLRAINTE